MVKSPALPPRSSIAIQIALTMVCVWPRELPVIGRLERIFIVSAPVLPVFTPLQLAPPPAVAPAPERPLHAVRATSSAAIRTGAARHDERSMPGYLLSPAEESGPERAVQDGIRRRNRGVSGR